MLSLGALEQQWERLQAQLSELGSAPSPPATLFFAKCIPSWPPSPEIRTARAKF